MNELERKLFAVDSKVSNLIIGMIFGVIVFVILLIVVLIYISNSNYIYEAVPNMSLSNYNKNQLFNYVWSLSQKNKSAENYLLAYENNATVSANAYAGGVYSPTQNRIYLIPFGQSNQTQWHYIDCNVDNPNDAIVSYTHGMSVVSNGYFGGVFSPLNNRIYLIPYGQATQNTWHYIDCNVNNAANAVVSYTSGVTGANNAYAGGVYSPLQDRIYLVPYGQSTQMTWHYIDCSLDTVEPYLHGATVVANGYQGGVYTPTKNRIYLVPYGQSTQTNWHYIDCSKDDAATAIINYPHNVTVATNSYSGGVYDPSHDRIYLIPNGQSNQPDWHYIDCAYNNVMSYINSSTAVVSGFSGGVYSPVQNRIYLVPYAQSSLPVWYFIDCNTGKIVPYKNDWTLSNNGYVGGVFSPSQNRTYLVPFGQSNQTQWHYIQALVSEVSSTSLMAGPLFNKF